MVSAAIFYQMVFAASFLGLTWISKASAVNCWQQSPSAKPPIEGDTGVVNNVGYYSAGVVYVHLYQGTMHLKNDSHKDCWVYAEDPISRDTTPSVYVAPGANNQCDAFFDGNWRKINVKSFCY